MELKLPLEADVETGWTIDYLFLLKLQKCIGETEEDGLIGLEEIERVVLALQDNVKDLEGQDSKIELVDPTQHLEEELRILNNKLSQTDGAFIEAMELKNNRIRSLLDEMRPLQREVAKSRSGSVKWWQFWK